MLSWSYVSKIIFLGKDGSYIAGSVKGNAFIGILPRQNVKDAFFESSYDRTQVDMLSGPDASFVIKISRSPELGIQPQGANQT
jgi:hypothetical protein